MRIRIHNEFEPKVNPTHSLDGCWRHICLVVGTAALC